MREIPLTKGKVALVDDADFSNVSRYCWYAQKAKKFWYAARRDGGKLVLLHRVILGITDRRILVDHENHKTLDCTRHNLRIASASQNQSNQRKSDSPMSSRFKGVCRVSPRVNATNPFLAYVSFNGHREYLGYFPTEELAALAYNRRATTLHGEFACLNIL